MRCLRKQTASVSACVCLSFRNGNLVVLTVDTTFRMYSHISFIFFLELLNLICISCSSFNPNSPEMVQLIEQGKNRYMLIQKNTQLPTFGLCWTKAVSDLTGGCENLNEHLQSEIALKFTDCFLETSGLEPYKCADKSLPRDKCLKNMSTRDFHVYTEFYTHTQNMCFFLKSQIWHKETEETIDKLSTSSAQVASQLKESEQIQFDLLQQQKESVSLQNMLLENGKSLGHILEHSQENIHQVMQEFRLSILEQKGLLFDVFERLSALQVWAVGEISWFDTVIFYVSSIIICYIITALPRTQDARFLLFVTVTVNAVIERIICNFVVGDGSEILENVNDNIQWVVWYLRRTMIIVCLITLIWTIFKYRDYNTANYQLLLEIKKQNLDLMSHLANISGLEKSNRDEQLVENSCKEIGTITDNFSSLEHSYSSVLETPTPSRSHSSSPMIPGKERTPSPQEDIAVNSRSYRSLSTLSGESENNDDIQDEVMLSAKLHTAFRRSLSRSSTPTISDQDVEIKLSGPSYRSTPVSLYQGIDMNRSVGFMASSVRKPLNRNTTIITSHYDLRRHRTTPST